MPARAVYTALVGGYEELAEQPLAASSDLPWICFTDDPGLTSDSWDVRVVEPALAMDPVRSARALKLLGHPDLAAYDETLWVDARVRLDGDPGELLDTWLDGADLALPRHSYRADVVAEFEAVLLAGFDDHSRLYEQLTHYAAQAPELLQAPVPWTAILARRHTDAVETAMREWWWQLLRYSRRDQLSVVHALHRADLAPRLVDLPNHESPVHTWLAGRGRPTRPNVFRVADTLQPPVALVGELRGQLERKTVELAEAVEEREQQLRRLEARLAQREGQLTRTRERLARVRGRLTAARADTREAEARLDELRALTRSGRRRFLRRG
ncbi:glycosyltransferase domain-containing protein [Nocardioides sp. SYSU D00038]|uniref:glycosyltransferase domain-containing protein n=1 Tax=Nocardioides sp. SYSU D00038 TaxID=2812554 RepID=UPI00196786F3|nr:glycosyltransferase domain-containing protein [Nocardioides sp. SYSU D00038]